MQLVRKSVSLEFRDFLRIQSSHMNRLFTNLAELVATSPVFIFIIYSNKISKFQTISLSSACLLYFMARDRKGIPVSEVGF